MSNDPNLNNDNSPGWHTLVDCFKTGRVPAPAVFQVAFEEYQQRQEAALQKAIAQCMDMREQFIENAESSSLRLHNS